MKLEIFDFKFDYVSGFELEPKGARNLNENDTKRFYDLMIHFDKDMPIKASEFLKMIDCKLDDWCNRYAMSYKGLKGSYFQEWSYYGGIDDERVEEDTTDGPTYVYWRLILKDAPFIMLKNS